ncbi:uncharacterized protein LOC135233068 [Loxodonta africana]|uniref:uncharacterized protein LOC135233068 n=1 Tax=Loxodonta africana TaxID=9785 RepID=UPI0030D3949F
MAQRQHGQHQSRSSGNWGTKGDTGTLLCLPGRAPSPRAPLEASAAEPAARGPLSTEDSATTAGTRRPRPATCLRPPPAGPSRGASRSSWGPPSSQPAPRCGPWLLHSPPPEKM